MLRRDRADRVPAAVEEGHLGEGLERRHELDGRLLPLGGELVEPYSALGQDEEVAALVALEEEVLASRYLDPAAPFGQSREGFFPQAPEERRLPEYFYRVHRRNIPERGWKNHRNRKKTGKMTMN